MRCIPSRSVKALLIATLAMPPLLFAQTTHVVQVLDTLRFDPAEITIQAGDTVRWEDAAGGPPHNVVADDFSFSSGSVVSGFVFEHTFTEGGEFPYFCQPHRLSGMEGTVTVQGDAEPSVPLNAGHNGNWWSGPTRDGEGGQVEVADAGGGQLVFVITVYSYAPQGGQIFLIGVGFPDGDSVEIDIFITSGGVWGDDYDPSQVPQDPWGTGLVTANGCDQLNLTLTPNAEQQALGYTVVSLEFERLTTSLIPCPYPPEN